MSEDLCGCCGDPMEKAHRVHAGVKYCQRCYCREFKRLLCGGCGMFKRLLRSEGNPRCQGCIASQPCVRCRRAGLPVGVMTEFGPACNSCRTYFLEHRPCELCGTPTQRLTRMVTDEGEKQACPRCATADHRTCACCRRHRPCEAGTDGKWRCRPCIDTGQVPCETCAQPMPAGRGKRCEACYFRDRAARSAGQLVELMSRPRVREAFLAFTAWLVLDDRGLQRRVSRLRQHADFFVELDRLDDEQWSGEFLLRHLGTATLRRFELPVKWLELQGAVTLSEEDKQREADLRRVKQAATRLPPNTVARQVVEGFAEELLKRHAAGELSVRSARLALRPAISLLEVEDPAGGRLPRQAALERYLDEVPGQRAAVSTFLGFLRASHGVDLRLPPKRSATSPAARKALEQQVAALVRDPQRREGLDKRWVPLALRYFHRLSATEAKVIHSAAVTVDARDGLELQFDGRVYWVPKQPMLAAAG